MKLGVVTKLDKRKKTTSKKCRQIYGRFGAIGSRIPDAQSIKLTFSLKITFCLTKTENRTKKSLNSSHNIAFSKGTILATKR